MSRNRDDRDSDFYGSPRGRGGVDDDRYGQSDDYRRAGADYDDYGRGSSRGDFADYGYRRERGGFDRPHRDYDDRAGYSIQSRGYERGNEGRGDDDRSFVDDARDYFRRGTGGGGRRGAARSHVRCRDIMTRDVTVATRDMMLHEVAAMMRDEDTGVIPVVERPGGDLTNVGEVNPEVNRVRPNVVGGGKLIGLITDRDIVVRALAEGKDARTTRAEEIMTTDIHTAQPNDRVIDAIRKMGDKQVRRIPIVDRDGNLRGIISMADVALETEEDRELAEALEEISSGSSFWSKVFG